MSESAAMLGNLVLWGLIATVAMTAIMQASQGFGLSRLSIPFLAGTFFTANRDRAVLLGFAVYIAGGWLFAFLYYLLFASIGLYAVVAFAVTRRSREIGIRMALGARSQQVVWSIARGVAGLIGVGTGIGLVLLVLVMLAMRAGSGSADIGIGSLSVYQPSIDPVALLVIAAVTAVVGVAAAFVPGRRAALMDPLVALRHE